MYIFIENHQAEFSIEAMYRGLRVARSGWYAWGNRCRVINARQRLRQDCGMAVSDAFTRAKQRYGPPRRPDEPREQDLTFDILHALKNVDSCYVQAVA